MNDKEGPGLPPPTTQQMSIMDLIQIRAMLAQGISSNYTEEILNNLDAIILNFTKSLKGN